MNILPSFFSPPDENEFHGRQRVRREFNLNCRCLDVRNIVVSSHLITGPWSYAVEEVGDGMEIEEKLTANLVPLPVKSPRQLQTNPCWERFNTSNSNCAQTHSQTGVNDPPPQKNRKVAESKTCSSPQSEQTNIKQQRLKQRLLPLTRSHWGPASSCVSLTRSHWGPASSCVSLTRSHWGPASSRVSCVEQSAEELAVPWRCRAMVAQNPEPSRLPSRILPNLQNTIRASGCEILELCRRMSSRMNCVNHVSPTTSGTGTRPVGWRLLGKPVGDGGAQVRVGQPEHHSWKVRKFSGASVDSHSLTSLLHNSDCGSGVSKGSQTQTHLPDTGLSGCAKDSQGASQQDGRKVSGSRRDQRSGGGVGKGRQMPKEESLRWGEGSTWPWDSESQSRNQRQNESPTDCDVTLLHIVHLLQCRSVNLSHVREEGQFGDDFQHILHNRQT
ncbi:uncharacterized protein LOC129822894 [Salvelinus fontinalis]|uniref:uncharacterized protein LOC129822894 n=1 Tax=Salvelinus fontinalis TaxID=8038 RepID=UPI002484E0B2|nr:uncharacterized protein LOC129822894 [Salvelinus fontinalis]